MPKIALTIFKMNKVGELQVLLQNNNNRECGTAVGIDKWNRIESKIKNPHIWSTEF